MLVVSLLPDELEGAKLYGRTQVSGRQQKLLGAYRLYVNGKAAGIGPGRGDCSLAYAQDERLCLEYDMIDLTEHLQRAQLNSSAGSGKLAIGIQSYHSGGDGGGVQLQLNLETASGMVVLGTNASWQVHDATDYFGPFSTTGGYGAPRENQNASAYPGSWHLPGYTPSPARSPWVTAEVHPSFPTNVTAKLTLPLSIETDQTIPVVMKIKDGGSEPFYFFDQRTEQMGGIHLEVPPPAGRSAEFKYLELTLSEELAGEYGTGALLYPMRTGNHYRYIFSLDPTIVSIFDIHEYALYRYGTIRFCNKTITDQDGLRCDGSPGHEDPAKTVAGGCVSAAEHEIVTLQCPAWANPKINTITNVTFASFGTPSGACHTDGEPPSFAINTSCHASNSLAVFEKMCVGKKKCTFTVDGKLFEGCDKCLPDGDPCHNVVKRLDLAISCEPKGAVATADARAVTPEVPMSLTSWRVAYPWSETDSSFSSSDTMLTKVYKLCRNTLKVTSLDTTTDSNTRERLPCKC